MAPRQGPGAPSRPGSCSVLSSDWLAARQHPGGMQHEAPAPNPAGTAGKGAARWAPVILGAALPAPNQIPLLEVKQSAPEHGCTEECDCKVIRLWIRILPPLASTPNAGGWGMLAMACFTSCFQGGLVAPAHLWGDLGHLGVCEKVDVVPTNQGFGLLRESPCIALRVWC